MDYEAITGKLTQCLYKATIGTIQVDIRASGFGASSPWQLFTDKRSPDKDIHLRNGVINCALHPLLTSQSGKINCLSQSIHKAVLWKKRCWDEFHQITENDQVCLDRVIVNVYLPHLYSACAIVAPESGPAHQGDHSLIDSVATSANKKTVDLAAGAAHQELQVLDSVISLLQNHFQFCKSVYLVLKTDLDPTMEIVAPLTDDDDARNASISNNEIPTSVTNFLEDKLLPRTDDLYRIMIQQRLSLKADDRGEGLHFLPSLRAFTPFEEKARMRGEVIREGDWDRNRDAEIAVWRAMDDLYSAETDREGTRGYWVKTDVFDMFPWKGMKFV
ncbi:hypothetical protein N7520_005356 [Penicillium odoratum]|uniref:uncharacterized protein n=1 Tax=Penicillium odoratum TaxID=1167516 RepID=UPI002547F791|nr:uncharacterized protein N7520_005356 [Penicillium odoratum]KAJ5765797.1 hypothetical protein N7520_005356 [Penicillium odoratum]